MLRLASYALNASQVQIRGSNRHPLMRRKARDTSHTPMEWCVRQAPNYMQRHVQAKAAKQELAGRSQRHLRKPRRARHAGTHALLLLRAVVATLVPLWTAFDSSFAALCLSYVVVGHVSKASDTLGSIA